MIRALALVVACGACGRVGFATHEDSSTADAGGDAACAAGEWDTSSMTRLANVNVDSLDDWEPILSADELTIVFSRSGVDSALFIATRAAITDDFGPPQVIPGFGMIPGEDVYGPSWSPDGRTLYFNSAGISLEVTFDSGRFGTPRSSLLRGTSAAFVSDTDVFTTANPVAQDYDLERYAWSGTDWVSQALPAAYMRSGITQSDGWPAIDAGRRELYFEHVEGAGAMLARARLGPSGELPAQFERLTMLGLDLGDPFVSRDGLRLYLTSTRRAGTDHDIYMLQRSCL